MKRDLRLHGLSSEHHEALVLARSLLRRASGWTAAQGRVLARRFEAELEPHFRVEESVLVPALEAVGARELVDRTLDDHTFLRDTLSAVVAGDPEAARAFGVRLQEHVRFEERELFPRCEALLPAGVLDEVARRAPKTRRVLLESDP